MIVTHLNSGKLTLLVFCLTIPVSSLSAAVTGDNGELALGKTANTDYRGALTKLLEKHPNDNSFTGTFYKTLTEWARSDFQAAEQWVIKTGFERKLSTAYTHLCHVLIEVDPDKAITWASTVRDERGRLNCYQQIYRKFWAKEPLKTRLDLVVEVPDPGVRRKLMWSIFREWGRQDYDGAMMAAMQLEDLGDKATAMEVLPGNNRGRKEIKQALSEAEKRVWDFDAVTQWTATVQDVAARGAVEKYVADYWLKKIPRKVAEWAPSTGNLELLEKSYRSWTWEDEDAAIRYVERIPDVTTRSQALVGIVRSRRLTFDRAKELTHSIEDPDSKEKAIKAVSDFWVTEKPVETIAWIRAMDDRSLRQTAYISIIQNRAVKDVVFAAELAEGINDPEIAAQATWIVAGVWAKNSPYDAMAWANGLENGAAKSGAQIRICKYCALYTGFKMGADLANTIKDKNTRIEALQVIYRRWQAEGYQKEGDAWLKKSVNRRIREKVRGANEIPAAFERFDENGDGKVDQTEIRNAATAILERMESKGLQGSWLEFDQNKNGLLDTDERESLLQDLIKRLSRNDDL